MDEFEKQQHCTPRKLLNHRYQQYHLYHNTSSPATFKFLSQQQNTRNFIRSSPVTPGSIKKKCSLSSSTTSTTFQLFPILNTPPSSQRFTKILNPFENGLTDRLHLPLICSPSLFQRPATPQHSSTQFEWTIEEVSSLGPANVEPYENQFLGDSIDPDIEAKAQAAISSYFKEHQIVPSPQNTNFRKNRLVLAETSVRNSNNILMGSPAIIKQPKRIRDGFTQTILTFPAILPPELEDALKPYFKYNQNQQQSPTNQHCDIMNKSKKLSIDYEARDASLRRKLFDLPNKSFGRESSCDTDDDLFNYNELSPPPKTPEMEAPVLSMRNSNGSIKESSFGSISPISKLTTTPKQNNSRISQFEKIIPNKCSSPALLASDIKNETSIKLSKKNILITKSSSDLSINCSNINNNNLKRTNSSPNLSIQSVDTTFNARISRLLVNSFEDPNKELKITNNKIKENEKKSKSLNEIDIFNQIVSNNYFDDDDDDMHVSQLSTISSKNDTPRRRRSPGRKNLSQSFSFHFSDTDDDNDDNINNKIGVEEKPIIKRRSPNICEKAITNLEKFSSINQIVNKITECNHKKSELNFYRTDSGFNEMSSNTQDELKFIKCEKNSILNNLNEKTNRCDTTLNEDINMICCSTPSKRIDF